MSVVFEPEFDCCAQPPVIPAHALDEQVVRAALWFYGKPVPTPHPGHFMAALFNAFSHADEGNLERLAGAFPAVGFWVAAFRDRSDALTLAIAACDRMGVKL